MKMSGMGRVGRSWVTITCGIVFIGVIIFVFLGDGENAKATKDMFAMDTIIQMTIYGNHAEKAISFMEEEVRNFESRFSITNPDGEASRLNQSNGGTFQASEDLLGQLKVADVISRRSGGAFDLTIYPVMQAWGFTTKEFRVPTDGEVDRDLALVDYRNIEIEGGRVRLLNGSTLDLGGIAKGFVGSKMKGMLKDMGVESAILSFGGDVQTVGLRPNGEKWILGIADPRNPEGLIGTVRCGEATVVTSGGYHRFFTEGDKDYHHIMDPRTGRPADSDLLSVTIMADDGASADALSTALFVLGEAKALEYYEEYGDFEAILVTRDGRILLTEGIRDSFEIEEEKGDYRIP